MFATKKKKVIYLFVFIVFFVVWRWMGYPSSFNEAVFLVKLQSAISKKQQTIDLVDLMPGNWELVCFSHGYDAPLHLKEYGKTYPQAGAMQEGAWGLIFIEPDGSYTPVSGSRSDGVYLQFGNTLCLPREQTILQAEQPHNDSYPQTWIEFTSVSSPDNLTDCSNQKSEEEIERIKEKSIKSVIESDIFKKITSNYKKSTRFSFPKEMIIFEKCTPEVVVYIDEGDHFSLLGSFIVKSDGFVDFIKKGSKDEQ